MAQNIRHSPQTRAPLQWGGGGKNLTASRHLGCLTKVPVHPQSMDRETERLNVGRWNVRTMKTVGKLENVKREMRRMKLNVLGMSECRYDKEDDYTNDGFRLIHTGCTNGQNGVAVMMNSEVGKRVTKVIQHSDRLLLVRLKAEPRDMVVIQVYMPTSSADDEEIERMYEQIEDLMKGEKATDNVMILGDFNAIVGEGRDGKEIGEFGLGKRNERGQALVDFCRRTGMVVTNTWFEHEKRRRYTWKRPGDTGRFQIDYILVKQRYRNSVKNSRAYPGADVHSDHNLVMAKIELKLKKVQRSKNMKKWRLDNLVGKKLQFQEAVEEELTKGNEFEIETPESRWIELREAVKNGAKKVYGYQESKRAKKPWITEKMIEKMDERRKWKNNNTEKGKKMYSQLNNELRRETDKAREEWWEAKCDELTEYDKRGRSDLLYYEVSRLTKTDKGGGKRNVAINDENGVLKTELDEVKTRWKE